MVHSKIIVQHWSNTRGEHISPPLKRCSGVRSIHAARYEPSSVPIRPSTDHEEMPTLPGILLARIVVQISHRIGHCLSSSVLAELKSQNVTRSVRKKTYAPTLVNRIWSINMHQALENVGVCYYAPPKVRGRNG